MSNRTFARAVAWCAFALGCTASVAANVAHAKPELGPRLASAFAPIALLLTVEIMSRVPWPSGWRWALGRFAGAGVVALVAAVTSYGHMYDLLRSPEYGESEFTAMIQPACVDGLMVVASLALLALGHADTPTPKRSTVDTPAAEAKAPADDAQTDSPAEAPAPAPPAPAPALAPAPAPAPVASVVRPQPVGVIRPPARLNGSR